MRKCVYATVREGEQERVRARHRNSGVFGSGSRSLYDNQLDCLARTTSVSNTHKLPLSHTQTQPLYTHYCQADAVQPSLTCSFSLIHLLPPSPPPAFFLCLAPLLSSLSLPLSLCLHPDGFDLGAAAHADGGQAQRVLGEPDGDRPTPPKTRGGLKDGGITG